MKEGISEVETMNERMNRRVNSEKGVTGLKEREVEKGDTSYEEKEKKKM